MSSTSAPSGIGFPQAGPLLDALRDNSPETRLAVLDALTRLPLEPDVWFEVREYVMWALNDPTAPEHLDVIETATRVPIRSVRQRLVHMAESGEPDERRRAALALGRAGESQAAGPLLALLDDEPAAAEVLALIDTSAVVEELEQRWKTGGGFWLAVALAKNGRGEALAAELEQLSNDPDLSEEWLYTDETAELEQALYRIAPLPEGVRAAVDRDWTGWFARHLVSDVLFSPPPAPMAVSSTFAASVATGLSPAERDLVEQALGSGLPEHDPYQAAPVKKLAADLYRPLSEDLERSAFDTLLVSQLLERAAHGERQSGDDAVLLSGALGAGFAPDVEGLFEAWRRCAADDELTRNQIAWTAGRAGMSPLLEELGEEIASDSAATARLIAAAASWTTVADPPLQPAGDEPKAPEIAPPAELLEDMLAAAAPPPMPEATATRSPPPAPAPAPNGPPVLAEANGGGPEPEPTAAREPRWILVWVTEAAVPEEPLQIAFRAGAVHEIAVAIGPNQEGAIAAVGGSPFDEELGPVADMEELTVTFLAPSMSAPLTGSIFLPRSGTSRPVSFSVKVPAELERFDAEIRVHHQNRVVQMARLSGLVLADPAQAPPGSRIELEIAPIVPETADLGDREPVDAGIVTTDAGSAAVADKDVVGFDDDRLGRVVREGALLDVLTGLATSDAARKRKLEDAVDDLRALVFQGCELYPVIGKPLVELLGDRPLDRLQVLVDERSDFFPVELVYDLPAPAKDATLCPGWKTALKKGACTRQHEAREGELHPRTFCPSGFWGLSKVIERRVVGQGSWRRAGAPEGFEIAVRLDPTTERDTLDGPHAILFAASDNVDAAKTGGIKSVVKALERITKETTYAKTWEEWVDGVTKRPNLLVLLSHTTEEQAAAALEIGEAETCLGVQLLPTFVRSSDDDAPIVLLLGCDTAVTDRATELRVPFPGSRCSARRGHNCLGTRPASRAGCERRRQGDRRGSEAAQADSGRRPHHILASKAAGDRRADGPLPDRVRRRRLAARREESLAVFRIEMLPAEQGDALFIEYGSRSEVHRVLIDAGVRKTSAAVKARIEQLPQRQRHFDLLIVTHVDSDHIGGIPKLLADPSLGLELDDVWFNGWRHLQPDRLGPVEGEIVSAQLDKRGGNWNAAFDEKAVVVRLAGATPEARASGRHDAHPHLPHAAQARGAARRVEEGRRGGWPRGRSAGREPRRGSASSRDPRPARGQARRRGARCRAATAGQGAGERQHDRGARRVRRQELPTDRRRPP